jgi:pimeloyl-ACP methyl ester carboxylesterase
VLVGHSFGGLNVRLYASEHLEDVAGMVLVDSSFDVSMFDVLRDRLHLDVKTPPSGPPRRGQEIDEAAYAESQAQVRSSTMRQVPASIRSTQVTVPPLQVPLVVLSAGAPKPPPPDFIKPELLPDVRRMDSELQDELAHLSSNSVRAVATQSGHQIQADAPEVVVAATLAVVEAARSHGSIDSSKILSVPGTSPP